jgi:hypothetical protein
MIRQNVYIEKYDWLVHIYYAVDAYYIEEILWKLYDIGCPRVFMWRAYENMSANKLNQGLTYSNPTRRETVMVIGLASSPAEYENSIQHELRHLVDNIVDALNLKPGEPPGYLTGETAMLMHPVTKLLTCECECCKKKLRDEVDRDS